MSAPEEPFGAGFYPDGAAQGFSLLSRGDRVRGRLVRPEKPGPYPLVLLAGPDGCAESGAADAAIAAFGAWAAVAAIDLPLCGARRSEKIAPSDLASRDSVAARLREDLELQVQSDLTRTLRFLRDALPATRAGFFACGLGARLALRFCRTTNALEAIALAPAEGDSDAPPGLGERGRIFAHDAPLDEVADFLRSRLS